MGNGKLSQQRSSTVRDKDLEDRSPSCCLRCRKKHKKDTQPKTEEKADRTLRRASDVNRSTLTHTSGCADKSEQDEIDTMPDVPQEGLITHIRSVNRVRQEEAKSNDSSRRGSGALNPIVATYTRPYKRTVLNDDTLTAPWIAQAPTSPASCPSGARRRRFRPPASNSSEQLQRAARALDGRYAASDAQMSASAHASRSQSIRLAQRNGSFVRSRQMGSYRVDVTSDEPVDRQAHHYGTETSRSGSAHGGSHLSRAKGSQARFGAKPEELWSPGKKSTVNFDDSDAREGTRSIRLARSPGSQMSRLSRVARISDCSSRSLRGRLARAHTDNDGDGMMHDIHLAVPEGGKSGMLMLAPSMCRVTPPECKEVHVLIPADASAGLILSVKVPVCQCVLPVPPTESRPLRRRSSHRHSTSQRRATISDAYPSPRVMDPAVTSSKMLERLGA